MDLVTLAKNTGAVLGTASVIAYVTGYLALRARAFALGTEPAFKLVDEVYVFAGFRAILITLIVLFAVSPAVLLFRWGAMLVARSTGPGLLQPVQWVLLVGVAVMTLLSLKILATSAVLLQSDSQRGGVLSDAILGGATGLRLLLTFAIVLTVSLSALWLKTRLAHGTGPFEWLLAMVVALQLVLLPVYHGFLFADRMVRVLAVAPSSAPTLNGAVAVVDRTGESVTLLGMDAGGRRQLVTVDLEDLYGLPVQQVLKLHDFIGGVLGTTRSASLSTGSHVRVMTAEGNSMDQTQGGPAMPSEDQPTEKGFFASLVEELGILLDAIGSLGESVVESGELWVVELDSTGAPTGARRIGAYDDLAWPVAGVGTSPVHALQRGRVVRIDAGRGTLEVLDADTTWSRLLGVREDGAVFGLVRRAGVTRPATLSAEGELQVGTSPLSEEDKAAVARLMQETRAYAGGKTLRVDRSERGGRGFDVYLRTGDGTFNLSDCADDACGQPSMSPDLRRALFIRQRRF